MDFQQLKMHQLLKTRRNVILLYIINMFFDLLFPKSCVGCKKIGRAICESCRKEIKPTLQDVCPYCFQNSPQGKTHDRCKHNNGLDGALSIVRYNKITQKIVKDIKYGLAYDVFNQVKEVLPVHWWRTEIYKKLPKDQTLIQPIPLHTSRKKVRGFNQAQIIADYLSHQTGIAMTDSVIRIKSTPPQARISTKEERKKNIKGAFSVVNPENIRGKIIILVDDIFTSASTAKETAKVLKENGAETVLLYTFAHGS